MQVIKGTRTTNVHYIGILLQHQSRDLRCREGMGSSAKEFKLMTCKTRLKSSRKH